MAVRYWQIVVSVGMGHYHKWNYSTYKSKMSSYLPLRPIWFYIASLHTMRLSSVFALAVIVASASSVSAIDDSTDHCPIFCKIGDDAHCKHCLSKICVSFSGLLPGFNHITHRHGSSAMYAWWVRVVFLRSQYTDDELLVVVGRWVDQCVGFWTNFIPTRALEIAWNG